MKRFSDIYISDLKETLDSFPHNEFDRFIDTLLNAYETGKHVFVMGNGGSASTASHFACDLNKGCSLNKKKRFKVLCLNDNISTLLAYANDLSYEHIFIEQLKNFLASSDIVIGISGSGNSPNVLKAIQYANDNGGFTIGFCGYGGGKLYEMVHLPILAPIRDMQKVEDYHMIIVHMTMQRLLQKN